MWTFENIGDVTTELYVIDKITDAVTGTKSLHYYSTSADGIEFKAKPMGSRELKQIYRNDIDKIVGKMATVKFFYYSEDGVPLQPVLKCIRDYE